MFLEKEMAILIAPNSLISDLGDEILASGLNLNRVGI